MSLDEINKMINQSRGLSNILTGPNNISDMLGKRFALSKNIAGMDLLRSQTNSVFSIGSANWLKNNSVFQHMSMPNNIFNLSKGLGIGVTQHFSQNIGQEAMTKALNQGISSLIGNSSFSRLLDTQHNILNQLTGLGPKGFKADQYRNVFNTLGSLSANTALTGLSSLNSTSYPYLEEVANEAEGITNSVVQQQYVTNADLSGIYNLIDNLNSRIDSVNKSEFKTLGFWLCLIGLFISIYPLIQQQIDALDPNTASATQQQVIDLRNKLIAAYHDNANVYSPVRITSRKCKLHLKPRFKSKVVMTISTSEKLSVINSKRKWVMVTCLDKDSLPITGWVLKKYLAKTKSNTK